MPTQIRTTRPRTRFLQQWTPLFLCAATLLLACAQRAALAQGGDTQQQQQGAPPPGPPPDGSGGGAPGGSPAEQSGSSSSTTADTSTTSSGSNASQGSRRPGPPSPAMELDRIIGAMKAASVPLSDTQKVALLGILEDKQTAMEALRTQSDRITAMQQSQALEQSTRTAVLATMTEAQQKVYTAMRQGPPRPPFARGSTSASGGMARFSAPATATQTDANTGGGVVQEEAAFANAAAQ